MWTVSIATLMLTSPVLTAALDAEAAEEPEDMDETEDEVAVVLPRADGDDPHLWLEDVLGDEPLEQVKAWNAATMAEMEADPRFQQMQDQALEVLTSDARLATGPIRGDHLYNFWRSPEHVRGIWRRTPLDAYLDGSPEWDVLLDLDALAESEGENWVWHGAHCAPKSERCLVDLSRGGSDASVIREFDRATKAFVSAADGGFALEEAKHDVQMVDEDTLLVGTDLGEGSLTDSGYPRVVQRWTRGQPLSDAETLFEGETTDVSASGFVMRHRKNAMTFLSRDRTFYERDLYRLVDGEAVRLPFPARTWVWGLFGDEVLIQPQESWEHGGETFASGSLVLYDPDGDEARSLLTPGEGQSIERVAIAKKQIFVQTLSDVVGELWAMKPKGRDWTKRRIELPDNGQVALVGSTDDRDDVLVTFESLTQPVTLFHVDKKGGVHELESLPSFFDASDITVEQRFATSADGTRVPYFLMARADVLEGGPAPTIQYGYGGFTASILPTYFRDGARPQHGAFAGRLWVRDGGALVLSNIRGGGEYGPEWHQAALKHDRQRAYEDFFAIGEALVEDGVTTPEQLGAIGRSNGGLLMGVVLTQRPDLYRAIDIGVPLLDMLHYHELLAGASWMGEYGDPDVPEERKTLASYSPYHHLDADADYPRVLFYTSTRDDRVHPGHARKMAAALASLDVPFYYWENIEGGHGGVANQEQAALRLALEYLYFKKELGLD